MNKLYNAKKTRAWKGMPTRFFVDPKSVEVAEIGSNAI